MALPKTNLHQVRHVALTISEVSGGKVVTDLASLCKSTKVNQYSRYRPGYWTDAVLSSQTLTFVRPDGSSTDRRGTRPSTGESKLGFYLGDFRGYNHTAVAPFWDGDNPRKILFGSSNTSGASYAESVTFNFGEVDWFGKESEFHGTNDISGCTQVVAVNSSGTVLGYMDYADLESTGSGYSATFDINVTIPSSGSTNTTVVRIGLGTANKLKYYVPCKEDLTIEASKITGPSYIISMDESCASTIYGHVSQWLSNGETSVYDIQFQPTSGTFLTGATTLSFSTTDAILIGYPYYVEYRFTSPKVAVSYRVTVYDKPINGTQKSTWTGTGSWVNKVGVVNISIPLNLTAQDGYWYKIEITDVASTNILSKI